MTQREAFEAIYGKREKYHTTREWDAMLQAWQAAQKWQPIETAPKDETEIIVMYMHIDTQIVHNACWLDDYPAGWWSYDKSESSRVLLDDWMEPTHWMPLPPPPKD